MAILEQRVGEWRGFGGIVTGSKNNKELIVLIQYEFVSVASAIPIAEATTKK